MHRINMEVEPVYISIGTIITAGSLIGALGVIGGLLIAAYKFFKKPDELEEKLKKIRETHEEDIRKINEEQCLVTYGLLACLKGLKEQGCNGPVTEAISSRYCDLRCLGGCHMSVEYWSKYRNGYLYSDCTGNSCGRIKHICESDY